MQADLPDLCTLLLRTAYIDICVDECKIDNSGIKTLIKSKWPKLCYLSLGSSKEDYYGIGIDGISFLVCSHWKCLYRISAGMCSCMCVGQWKISVIEMLPVMCVGWNFRKGSERLEISSIVMSDVMGD